MTSHSNLKFDPIDHCYYLNDERIPGISKILAAGGLTGKMPYNPAAMNKGIRIHKGIEYLLGGDLDFLTVIPEDLIYLKEAEQAVNYLKLQISGLEMLVCNETKKYATQIDVVAVWEGQSTVINWKTGRKYSWHGPQTAGEAGCFTVPMRRLAIYLSGKGEWTYKEYTEQSDLDMFDECLKKFDENERKQYATGEK
jgi:hypothetical protein